MKPAAAPPPGKRDERAVGNDPYPRRFGPYVLIKPLARGGMGALYLALTGDRGMEKLCVIKTALSHLADRGYVQRFRDEAKVVVRLSHGNLVTVFDAGQASGEIFLAMDFIEGKDLRAVWNRCAQKGIAFPIDVAVHITKELVRGLGYAHTFGGLNLIHRDVSPPNVLLSYTGEVKLTDFGLASSTLKLEKTAPGVIYGKVSYMAPEQARGDALDGRTDLYAAAIMLWELLTGRQLFPVTSGLAGLGNSEDDVLERVRQPKVPAPSSKTKRVPPELDRIVVKALASDRADRYQSGEEFRADLAAFQAKTAPATDGEHVAAFLRRLFGDDMPRERAEREQVMAAGLDLLPVSPSVSATVNAASEEEKTPELNPKGSTRPMDPARDPSDTQQTPPPFTDSSPTGQVARHSGNTEAMHSPAPPSEAQSQLIGAILGGRYRIIRLIGEGGMGRVYEAEHIEIGKRVAVKVLHPAYTRTPDVVERFRREARAASKIGHRNIVNVTDSGTTDEGSFFFVMEIIEGIELGLLIHREGPLPVKRALRIADQMCQALQAAHDAGVIHRDLKPENVLLVTEQGRHDFVKVLDFGIAKSADMEETARTGRRLTRPGVAMGTPEYMAPEQAAGKPADPRSDIYAVGSIIYEMLTGDPPYEGDNVMEVLHKKATASPTPVRELRPDVPMAVEALCERAMARRPEDRPQTMNAFASEIALVLEAFVGRRTPTEMREAVTGDAVARRPSKAPEKNETGFFAATIEPKTLGPERLPSRRARVILVASLGIVGLLVGGRAWLSAGRRPAAPAITVGPPPAVPAVAVAAPAPVEPATPEITPPPSASGTDEWSLATGGNPATPGSDSADDPGPEEPEAAGRPGRSGRAKNLSLAAGRTLLRNGQRLLTAQKYDEAKASFRKALASKALRGQALVGLGQIAFQDKDYAGAVKFAKDGASAGGGVSARVLLGDAFFKLGQFKDAREAYAQALKLDPKNEIAARSLDLADRRMH